MRVEGGHVKSAHALILEFAVLDRRAVVQQQVGYRVGEIGRIDGADVAFENGNPAVFAGHDEIARMPSSPGFLRGRDKQQVNGRRNNLPRRNLNEGTVLKEGVVQCGEGVVPAGRAACKMLFHHEGICSQCRGQTAGDGAWRQRLTGRQIGRIMAVDKHQAAGGLATKCEVPDDFRAQAGARQLKHRLERQPGDGSDVGEAPILVLEGRKPKLGKARNTGPPQS